MKSTNANFWEWFILSTMVSLLLSYGVLDFITYSRVTLVIVSLLIVLIYLSNFLYDLKIKKDPEKIHKIKLGALVGIFVSFSSVLIFLLILNFFSIWNEPRTLRLICAGL